VSASGSTFTSSVTNATSTPAISLTIPLASVTGTTAGLLSKADYDVFNAKQATLTAGSGISISSGTISATGITTSNLSNSAGITNGQLANSSLTLGTTSMSLGGTYSSVTGLGSLSTAALKVTAGNYTTTNAVLTNDGAGNAVWSSNGLYTLNGISAASQTFSTTTTATSTTPVFNSSGSVHTLNIPLASVSGTAAGLLSNTEYAAFNAKQGALTAGSGISILGGTISATGITSNNLSSSAGITNTQLANSSITLGTTSMNLGGTYANVAGLSSITSTNFVGTLSGTASGLTTARTISTTGDITSSGIFDGTSNLSLTTSLTNSGVVSGTYGSSSVIPKITVDAKGRVTSLEEISVGSSVIGAPLTANKIIVGSNTNTAADVYMSGDVAIVSSGSTTVNSMGGVSSSTISTVASNVLSATTSNTPNTIVKRDGSGGFSTGTITGTLSGTASSANALTSGRTISTSGDVTYTSTAFDGTTNVTGVATLANSGVVNGTYGTATSVPMITVDSKGRITNASAANIPSATGTVTGLLSSLDYTTFSGKQNALTLGTGVQTFLATPTSNNLLTAVSDETGSGSLVFATSPSLVSPTLGVATATSLSSGTLSLTTALSTTNGGTGQNSFTTGDILYASATNTLSKLPIGSTGTVLTVNGGLPSWGSNGVYSLNGQSATTHNFATSNSGADFTITSNASSSTATHTFNLPDAGTSNRGLLNAAIGNQQIGGNKEFMGQITMTSNLITNGNLAVKNLKLNSISPSTPSVTVGAVLTATDTYGTVGWATSNSASSLSGGVAGAIPYQTAPNTTAFTAAGTSGQILVSGGTATPTWTSNITVGTVTSTSLITGTFKVTGGTLAAGSVLTSDANGNATWGSNGLYTLNGQGANIHNFATSSIGTDFTITSSAASSTATHTFNLPDASASNRGVVTTGTQTFAGNKTFSGSTTVGTLNATSITVSGNITSTTLAAANFTKAVAGAPAASSSTSTIDFTTSNLAYSTVSSANPAFVLNGLKNGGTYTLAWQNTLNRGGSTASFSSPDFTTFKSLGNYPVVSGKDAIYTFVVIGATVYYSMISEQ
jgi:hypothetical protein